jgi:hypothetical protein
MVKRPNSYMLLNFYVFANSFDLTHKQFSIRINLKTPVYASWIARMQPLRIRPTRIKLLGKRSSLPCNRM